MINPFPHPLVLGHRGAPLEQTENTLGSFARATRLGADGVELDVQLTRDGLPVVIHDDTLDRTMGVGGRVSRLSWTAIQRLAGAKVPSLEQTAAWAAAASAWLDVEIKAPGGEETILATLREKDLIDRTIISSFHWTAVRRAAEIDKGVRCFFLMKRWDGPGRRALEQSGASGICLRVDAASDHVLHMLNERGFPVVVWTVNRAETIAHLLRLGVAGIITDEPGLAAGIRSAGATR